MHDQTASISSGFHGSESESELLLPHWSCWSCGHLEHKPVEAKPLNTKEKCGTFMANAGNHRQESQETAKMRCDDYFEKFKYRFKEGLVKGKTFKAIWLEIKENDINLPSRSWLRKAYLDWIERATG